MKLSLKALAILVSFSCTAVEHTDFHQSKWGVPRRKSWQSKTCLLWSGLQ